MVSIDLRCIINARHLEAIRLRRRTHDRRSETLTYEKYSRKEVPEYFP